MDKIVGFFKPKKDEEIVNQQLILFDYQALDAETRIVVQQEDKEFDRNMNEANTSFIHACKNLQRIHEALKYQRPGFEDYCDAKGLPTPTAYKMLNVAEMSIKFIDIPLGQFGKSALYLLAAPSTPDEARAEAIERAEAGEMITHAAAKEIVAEHKSPSPVEEWRTNRVEFLKTLACFACGSPLEPYGDRDAVRCTGCGRNWLSVADFRLRQAEEETAGESTFEATAPISPALLKPVEQLEEEAAQKAAPGLDVADTDDAGEDLSAETEAEDDDAPAPTETLPDETQEPVSLPPFEAAAPGPPPEPAAPPPPLPPPTVGEAPWVLSISVRSDTPPLVTILHGTLPVEHLPDDVAQRIIDAIWARAEPLPAIAETADAPEGVPDWLIEK